MSMLQKILIGTLIGLVGISIPVIILKSSQLEIPELKNSSMDFGKVESKNEESDEYQIYSKKFTSNNEVINTKVTELIESEVNEFKTRNSLNEKVKKKDKAVLLQSIDTYCANENLVSIKITSMTKNLFEKDYAKSIKTINYNVKDNADVTLDKLFKDGYTKIVGENSSENYIFEKNQVTFFKGDKEYKYTYNLLKEYNNSKLLTANNYQITQEEYNSLVSTLIDKDRKMVAITFDDGPHASNTEKILELLSKYNAHATFFMLGENANRYPDIVKKVYDGDNEIGVHTWSHKQLTKLSEQEIANEINTTADVIEKITGKRPRLVRPPYGSINNTVKSAVDNPFILWDIDSLDWQSRNPDKIVPLVVNDVQDGDIILLHDIHSTTVPAVERILEYLVNNDYQIITVSQMLEAKGYDTNTTRVFYSARQ